MMNKGTDFSGGMPYGNGRYPVAAGMGGRDSDRNFVLDTLRMLEGEVMSHQQNMQHLLTMAHSLTQCLEASREQYNRSIAERDAAHRRLLDTNAKLTAAATFVKRFADVQDPIVASDGYTYDRKSIAEYLEECRSQKSKAYSQQTKEELTDVILPNLSLKRLVEHLKDLAPVTVPTVSPRHPIAATHASLAPRDGWVDDSMVGPRPMMGQSEPPVIGGITVPAPASTSNNAAHRNHRFDNGKMGRGAGGADAAKPALHPCLRVYGGCNFMNDCKFANYPYEACLNHIKGKCRFQQSCKELHVDPNDKRYLNTNSYANQDNSNNNHNNSNSHNGSNPSPVEGAEAAALTGTDPSKTVTNGEATEEGAKTEAAAAGEKAKNGVAKAD